MSNSFSIGDQTHSLFKANLLSADKLAQHEVGPLLGDFPVWSTRPQPQTKTDLKSERVALDLLRSAVDANYGHLSIDESNLYDTAYALPYPQMVRNLCRTVRSFRTQGHLREARHWLSHLMKLRVTRNYDGGGR